MASNDSFVTPDQNGRYDVRPRAGEERYVELETSNFQSEIDIALQKELSSYLLEQRSTLTIDDFVQRSAEANGKGAYQSIKSPDDVIDPFIRVMVIDLISMVCSKFLCQRETFHLAVDYMDRFLTKEAQHTETDEGIQIGQDDFYLVAFASLLIAVKVEGSLLPGNLEKYVSILKLFCPSADKAMLLKQESLVLRSLQWRLHPLTTNGWLGIYLQKASWDREQLFTEMQFSKSLYLNISRLLELCLMDSGSLDFSYELIAASAFYHFNGAELTTAVSSLTLAELYHCVRWMRRFAVYLGGMRPCNVLGGIKGGIFIHDSIDLQEDARDTLFDVAANDCDLQPVLCDYMNGQKADDSRQLETDVQDLNLDR